MNIHASAASAPDRAIQLAASGEAVGRAVGLTPALSSDRAGWNNVALYAWRGRCRAAHFDPLPEPALVYHTGGAPVVKVRQGRSLNQHSRPGLVTIIPAGMPVDWDIGGGDVHSYSVHLGSHFFAETPEQDSLAGRLRFQCIADPLLAASITALADELGGPAQRGTLYAEAISDMLALHLLRNPAAAPERLDTRGGLSRLQLRRTLDLMEERVETGITLQSLAEHAGLSRTYFAEAFQKATGQSPHRYLTQRRIARAQTLLQHTCLAIADIALQCGFSNQAHFSQAFRQAVGTTPGRYRLEVQ